MKKIRVLHTEWSDGWGGQEIRIINEMLAVREKGVEVFLACRDHAQIKQKALENGIKVFTLPFKGSFDIKTILALKRIIKEYHIDIINTHSGKDTWVGGIAAKLSKAKFIRTRHLSNPINPSRLNFINEWADFIMTTGEGIKDSMIKNNRINPDKIASVPTGVDEEIFDPSKFSKSKQEDEIHIGALGVVRSVKGYEYFIKAAQILLEKHDNLRFFIAGGGPMLEHYKKEIKSLNLSDKIVMLGHIEEVPQYISNLDIFVNSSKNEGVPQAVIQALMMNKTVVATNVGSTKDLYKDDNFLLCKSEDAKALATALEKLIIEKNFNPNTREYIVKNFSKSAMRDKVLSIYKKVLNR